LITLQKLFAAEFRGIFGFADFDGISLGVAYKNFNSKMKDWKDSWVGVLKNVSNSFACFSEIVFISS
jgi:hypothetical protein